MADLAREYFTTPTEHLREILELWKREAASCTTFGGCSSGSKLARRKIATIEAELRRRAIGGPEA